MEFLNKIMTETEDDKVVFIVSGSDNTEIIIDDQCRVLYSLKPREAETNPNIRKRLTQMNVLAASASGLDNIEEG